MTPTRASLRLLIQGDCEADYLAKCHEALRTGIATACDARSFGKGYDGWDPSLRTFPEISGRVFPDGGPDVVFPVHGIEPDQDERLEFGGLPGLDAYKMLLLGDYWNVSGDASERYARFLDRNGIDLVLCYFPQPVQIFKDRSNAEFVFAPPCFDPAIFHSWDIPKQWDVGFLAAGTTDPSHWYPERRALHQMLLEQKDLRYLWASHPGWARSAEPRALVGEEFSRAIASCRMFVTTCGILKTPNPKYVEILASGALLVAEEPEGAARIGLVDGVTYVKITPENALERIRWYLDHPEDADRIALAGRRMAMRRHANHVRGREVVELLAQRVAGRARAPGPARPVNQPTKPVPGEGMEMDPKTLLEKNLQVLALSQPVEADRIRLAASAPAAEVRISRTGAPVPFLAGIPLHDPDDPQEEGRNLARGVLATNPTQRRLVVCGFGYGYHLIELVERGFSPIVWEPSAALVAQAFMTMDWTDELPFLTLVTGGNGPDFPRETTVFALPAWERLHPDLLARARGRMLPSHTGSGCGRGDGIFLSTYRNVTCLKNPHDLVVYQMLLHLVRPTLVLEIGAYRGGSALWIADQLATMGGDRRVHTYGVDDEFGQQVLDHPLIHVHLGGHAAFDPSVVRPNDRVLVIEDSSHTYRNTLEVLRKFAPYVSRNSYFIVEDGRAHDDHPEMGLEGGPLRASLEFLREQDDFVEDPWWENLFGTGASNCLHGILRRRA